MADHPQITLPQMCDLHQALLVHQAGYSRDDPWRALVIVAQVVLFQATTADPTLHDRIGDDIGRIGELGCLACFKPDVFGEIVHAAQHDGLGAIKAIGDGYVARGGARLDT